ncbi:hypothetical protein WKV53_09670 [Luteolibacter sp. Y139]|uniref:DUF4131 domain-containing protein n=2 Tax=Luteolibacter soli TaxID=3135280 RepID=A0ABU9AUY4_9BACT
MAVWAVVAFAACWLVMGLGPLSFLGAVAPFFLAVYFWRRSKGWSLVFGLVNPLVLTAILPVTGYFRGTAALHFHGLPGPGSFNLDRETRLPKIGGGCVVDGSEWLGDDWHNFVLRGCVSVFGPMKGTPSGPYPDEEVLRGPWPEAEWVKVADFNKGEILVGSKSRKVPQGQRLLKAYAPWAEEQQASPPDPMWDDEEFAIRLQAKDFGGGAFAVRIGTAYAGAPLETTILFAGEPARVVGYFWPKESRSRVPRFPPVRPGT